MKLLPRDGELYVLARSLPRRGKESAMRRKKLKAYWARLKELRKRDKLTRDDLLLAIGAAKEKAGRNAHRHVILHLPAPGEPVTSDTFRIELDREKLKATRRHEGQYLLRSNLTGEDPAELWRNYINLVRIEESFRNLKGDLGLRPVFHKLDGRIEAHPPSPRLRRAGRLHQLPRLLPARYAGKIQQKGGDRPEFPQRAGADERDPDA